jgi:hypothetical protein
VTLTPEPIAPLARFCTVCGREREPGARFCVRCGSAFRETDPVPEVDLPVAVDEAPAVPYPVAYRTGYTAAQSRLAAAFRVVLAVPHLLLLALELPVSLGLAVLGWALALLIGRLPGPIRRFQAAVLAHLTRTCAYLVLQTGRFPPFAWQPGERHPVRVDVAPAQPLPRLRTLVVVPLAIPAVVTAVMFGVVSLTLAIGAWFAILATGRLPRTIYDMQELAIGFQCRTLGHMPMLLTMVYPWYESGPLLPRSRR